jgi:hypothetical protein
VAVRDRFSYPQDLRPARYRSECPTAFLAALDKAAIAAGLAQDDALNLDFHAVMHGGEDPVLEKHYVPRRSQRTRSVLIFDSKLTTQAILAELDVRKIGFITLRARHPGITKTLAALPASAWKPMTLGRAGGKTRRIRVHDDPAATLSAYPRPIRELAVTGLGHDQPTC